MQQWWRVYAVLGTLVGVTFALEGILGAPPTAFAVTAVVVGALYSLTWLTGVGRPPGRSLGRGDDGPDRELPPT
ncbi:MAG TPA: hypothetical protein VMU51_03565 [Mycobacteriales bacterium]|nr:hypothetical protein [Mycobacteriales bacterium]